MTPATFAPGFRLSATDIAVLAIGIPIAAALWMATWWWGFVVFCNVVRMARSFELRWAAIFLLVAIPTVAFDYPGWPATISTSLVATIVFVFREMRKPSYHGVLWQTINPQLPAWWEAQCAATNGKTNGDNR
jgi:uncharacterized membrane protein YtjA (UPF0391 family)